MKATRRYDCMFYGRCLDEAARVNGSLDCAGCLRFTEFAPEGEPDSFFEDYSGGREKMTEEQAVYGNPDKGATVKRCSKCGEEKPLDAFNKERNGKYGRRGECKACQAAKTRERIKAKESALKARNEPLAPAATTLLDVGRLETALRIARAIINVISDDIKEDMIQPKVVAAIYEELG